MSLATTPDIFVEHRESGLAGSAVAAVVVHVLLAVLLFFGVRWSSSPPEVIEVELWSAPPPVVAPAPAPVVVEAPPPEPRIARPDIALKAQPNPNPSKAAPRPRVESKAAPKEEQVDPKLARKRDEETRKQMFAELAKEQASLASERKDAEQKEAAAKQVADARSRALADWTSKIRGKIRGNIVLPPEVRGNPEAVFDIEQLPTGEVLNVLLRRSSGQRALDEAIERAILKSSPLPKPDKPELFARTLEIRYRPVDL